MSSLNFSAIEQLFPDGTSINDSGAWTTVVAGVLMCFGKEQELEGLVAYILKTSGDHQQEQLTAMRVLRDGVLKAGALSGFPRGINSLNIVHNYISKHHEGLASILAADRPLRITPEPDLRKKRGYEFFSKVYGQHTERVISALNESSAGDMGEFAVNHIYADILSETTVVGESATGLLEFACCLALGTEPQAKGHMFGARNLGCSGPEVRSAISLVKHVAKETGVMWSDERMPWLEKAESWE